MNIEHDDGSVFKAIFELLSRMVDETLLKFEQDGLSLKSMDPAHVALLSLNIPRSSFKTYELPEESYDFGINTQFMSKIFKNIKSKETISLSATDYANLYLVVAGRMKRTLVVKNLGVTVADIPPINLPFEAQIKLSAELFRKLVETASGASDSIVIRADEDGLTIESESVEGNETQLDTQIPKDSEEIKEYNISTPVKASYIAQYILDALLLSKLSDDITIKFSNDKPLELLFSINVEGKASYILAPKT